MKKHFYSQFLCVSIILAGALPVSAQSNDSSIVPPTDDVSLTESDQKVTVKIDGELFTEYYKTGFRKPILYPILGPGQIPMTRNWPIKENVAGEAHDHPHHKSMWFSHEINGIDFWSEAGGITQVSEVKLKPEENEIIAESDWIRQPNDEPAGKSKNKPAGEKIFSDTTEWRFGHDEDSRWIDATIQLHADQGDVTFNDTKEGTFAIRTNPDLRLTASPQQGVDKVFGSAINSNGETGKSIWGKSAKWVLYSGLIDGKPMSLAMFDHPKNLRHPTTWHARDYGLVAANPFGLHYFQGAETGAGAYTIKSGETLKLRYRAVFIRGLATPEEVERKYEAFAK